VDPEATAQAAEVAIGDSLAETDVHVADLSQDVLGKILVLDADHQLEVLVVLQAPVVEVGRSVDGEAKFTRD